MPTCSFLVAVTPSVAELDILRRGYAAAVGGIIVIPVRTTDRGGTAIIAWRVISTCGGGADSGSADRSRTDPHRHSRAHTTVIAATIHATAIHAAAVSATTIDTSAVCEGVG
jgi:hypothetical protein